MNSTTHLELSLIFLTKGFPSQNIPCLIEAFRAKISTASTYKRLNKGNIMLLELPAAAVSPLQSEGLTQKYQMIHTTDVVDIMTEHDFIVTQVHSMKPRVRDPRVVQHFIRLRHKDFSREINGAIPEVLVVNSNDGSTSLRMDAALFRLICGNGLIVKSADIYRARIRHVDVTEQAVIEESKRVIEAAMLAAQRIERFQKKILMGYAVYNFASEASELALKIVGAAIKPGDLLVSRRDEDSGSQLWNVLNRVQENLVKGGIVYRTPKGRQMTSRGITGATPLIQMNEQLWSLAEEYL
jgi:hypothetical protein